MKKIIFMGLGILSVIGIGLAAFDENSDSWTIQSGKTIFADTTNIATKSITDTVTHTEFNSIVNTVKGIYHSMIILSEHTTHRFGFGVSDPQMTLDVAGGIKIRDSFISCGGNTEGSLRYRGSLGVMELCNGTEWKALVVETECVPQTCAELGFECEVQDDGCGGTVNCGTCTTESDVCVAGTCEAVSCSSNADCDDENVCTDDSCSNPGTAESVCINANNSFTESCTAELGTCTNTGARTCNAGSLGACDAPVPVPSTWTPAVSTICDGNHFIQTSNCGTTRNEVGTKCCETAPTSGTCTATFADCGEVIKNCAGTFTCLHGSCPSNLKCMGGSCECLNPPCDPI